MMSQVKRKVTPCAALALAAALGLGMLAVPARALGYVNKTAEHSLTITLSTDSLTEYREDLDKVPTEIPVQVFKVAEINVGGTYNVDPTGPFAGFSDELADPAKWKDAKNEKGESISETAYWQGVIKDLVETLYDGKYLTTGDEDAEEGGENTEPAATPVPSITVPGQNTNLGSADIPTVNKDAEPKEGITPAYSLSLTADKNYSEKIDGNNDPAFKGLYLIVPLATDTRRYEYRFTPSLVSVPQTVTGSSVLAPGMAMGAEQNWSYDVTAYLKPERKQRLGKLVVEKKLSEYNESLGRVPFVFEIEATLDGETVYSNVVTMHFDKPGQQKTVLDDIPVGATVTVKEVYSGASYKAEVSEYGNFTIPPLDEWPDGEVSEHWKQDMTGAGETSAYVFFENTYDENIIPGIGLENRFTYQKIKGADGGASHGWDWEKNPGDTNTETAGGEQG